MTKLTHSIEIQRPLKDVYSLAREVENYPTFLPSYLESRIVERHPDRALLQRSALIRGKIVHWESWVRWKENEAIHFVQKEGPLKGMLVNWRFIALTPDSTHLTITHLFDISRPFGLGRAMEKWIFKPRLDEIATQIISAFKFACEKQRMVPI